MAARVLRDERREQTIRERAEMLRHRRADDELREAAMLIDIGRRMEMLAARDIERRARLMVEDDDIPERRRERRPRAALLPLDPRVREGVKLREHRLGRGLDLCGR